MNKNIINIEILLSFILILIIFNNYNNNKNNNIQPNEIITTDTIYHTDTIVKDSFIPKYIKVKEIKIDTLTLANDTVKVPVELPIEQVTYEDSLYHCVISGFQPKLDTLTVYPVQTIIYKEKVVNKPQSRVSWGIQAGFGYGVFNKKPDLFIGIGLNIKL